MAKLWISFKRAVCLMLTLALAALAAGCWDRIEIEKRGFVIGAAVDLVDQEQPAHRIPANPLYRLTNQIVVPDMLAEGGEQGGKEGDAYLNVSATGYTFFGINREMATSTSRAPFTEHLKLIVLSRQVAEAGLIGPVLDVYTRDHEMRRSTRIIVSEGAAADALTVDSENEWLPVLFIQSIAENTHKTSSLLPGVRIGEVQEYMTEGYSFALPKIKVMDGKVEMSGAAVFRSGSNKMVGWLDGETTEGFNFVSGAPISATIEFEWQGRMCTFEIKRMNRIVKTTLENEKPVFTIDLAVSGNIGEMHHNVNLMDSEELWTEVERAIARQIEARAQLAVDKLKDSYHVDAFGLGRHVQRKYYKLWDKLRSQWDGPDGAFADSTVNTRVHVELRSMGTVIKTG